MNEDSFDEMDTITTYADGYGVWHARISCASHGYGNAGQWAIDRHWDRLRAMARRAIRREIISREQHSGETLKQANARIAPVRLEVVKVSSYPSDSIIYALEFKERSL